MQRSGFLSAHKTVLMMVFNSSSEVLLLAKPMREHSNASQPPTLICGSQPWSLWEGTGEEYTGQALG